MQKEQVSEILELVQKIASGDFSARLQDREDDELFSALAAGLNAMAGKIHGAVEKMSKAKARLQQNNIDIILLISSKILSL